MKSIGHIIKWAIAIQAFLIERGITQLEFANQIDVDPTTVNRWVNRKHAPSKPYQKILKSKGITI